MIDLRRTTHGARAAPTHVQWPADRFYWGVLDGSLLSRRARSRRDRLEEALGFLFEGVLPGVVIDDVHAVYHRLSDARYLACGVDRGPLDEVAADATTLTPSALPSFLDGACEPQALNLLTGDFAPRAVRAGRRRLIVHASALLVLCAAMAMFGLERRAAGLDARAAAAKSAEARLFDDVLGADARGAGTLPPTSLLTAELRLLERTRTTGPDPGRAPDCSRLLARILAAWPGDVRAATEAIGVGAGEATIRAQVPTMADAQRLADALGNLSDWRLLQPQSETVRGAVVVTLRLESQEADR